MKITNEDYMRHKPELQAEQAALGKIKGYYEDYK
jgi:hypothetical protein